jgi:hypothetical protein
VRAGQNGQPVAVWWRGQWRAVTQVGDCWRLVDEWWRDEIVRMYYEVVLDQRVCLTIFHDLRQGDWYHQPAGALPLERSIASASRLVDWPGEERSTIAEATEEVA